MRMEDEGRRKLKACLYCTMDVDLNGSITAALHCQSGWNQLAVQMCPKLFLSSLKVVQTGLYTAGKGESKEGRQKGWVDLFHCWLILITMVIPSLMMTSLMMV